MELGTLPSDGPTAPPRALVVCRDATPGVVLSALHGFGLEVERAVSTAAAHELVTQAEYRLVVLLDPLPMYPRLLAGLRSPGSPSRGAGVIVAAEPRDGTAGSSLAVAPNRMIALERLEEELPEALSSLLMVAPRSPVRAWARLAGRVPTGAAHSLCRTLNLSTTGMLLRGTMLPVGTELEFELRRSVRGPAVGGRARVVRHGHPMREPAGAMGLQILQLADGGSALLERFVQRATTAVLGETVPPGTLRRGNRRCASELEELEHQLVPGLMARLRSPDWYLTGVELGLESLRDFHQISQVVFRGDVVQPEVRQHLARLEKVQGLLSEFANPGRALEQRVMIMVEARPFLERLVEELECTSHGRDADDGARSIGVDRVVGRIVRTAANRDSLQRLRAASDALLAPSLTILPWRRRSAAAAFARDFRALLRALGVAGPEELASAAAVRSLQARAEAEVRALDDRLQRIHRRIYVGRFAVGATGDIAGDLAPSKVTPVLQAVLASGRQYLERAFSAYRHALELRRPARPAAEIPTTSVAR